MGRGIDDICARWVEINSTNPGASTPRTRSNVYYTGETIYSYGSHFPMGRAIKNAKGATVLWLLNGDTFSVSTTRHQSSLRWAVSKTDIPSVIIPFSALEAASITPQSVRVLEVSNDRTVVTQHETFERPEGSVWRTDDVMGYVDLTEGELAVIIDRKNAEAQETYDRYVQWHERDLAEGKPSMWKSAIEQGPRVHKVDDLDYWQKRAYRKTGEVTRLYRSRRYTGTYEVEQLPDGRTRYSWETRRHWLGESLIEATVTDRRVFKCGLCKGTGLHADAPPQPAYPSSRAHRYVLTVAGRDALVNEYHEADAEWEREWGTLGKRCTRCGGTRQKVKNFDRTRKFLSGFDRGESRPSYFFCELPVTDAATVEEALEALKPDTVRMAEQIGRTVHRQGDIFAVQLSGELNRRKLRTMGAIFTRRGTLLGTNHEATETAILPDGTTLARGCLYHAVGAWRTPDHARVKLSTGFHVIVKNTVPMTA